MSEQRERVAHWVRLNEALRYPRRLVCLDSEARIEQTGRGERHTFRLAVASADAIDRETRTPTKTSWLETTATAELWAWVDSFTRSGERTIVAAHNLSYDLRLTGALEELPALGWELKGFSLDGVRCWARWQRGRRGLTMVDSMSYLPKSLATVGKTLGLRKLKLPAQDDFEDLWMGRCRRDVEILRASMLRLLDWLEANELGSFRLTGPAQAQAAFRHKYMAEKTLLSHSDQPTLDAERRSAYTGRAEVWRHGRHPGYLYEWDYKLAYAHLARRLQLPARFVGHRYAPTAEDMARLGQKYALLADVDVQTELPLVPTEHDGRILWPVGKFNSQLWDVELRLLDLYDQPYRIKQVRLYKREPLLAEWATWIIGELDGDPPAAAPFEQIVLKAWSRTLIGRFGLRYPKLELHSIEPDNKVDYRPLLDLETGAVSTLIQIGNKRYEQTGVEEGTDSTPAVMAYIMAASRFTLWATMESVGLDHVYYVDTDSLIVDQAGHQRLLDQERAGRRGDFRFKRRLHDVELVAPRVILEDGAPKIAGLSKQAVRTGKRTYRAPYWETVAGAIAHQRADSVTVKQRTFTIPTVDVRRRHRARGQTIPYRIDTLNGNGATP